MAAANLLNLQVFKGVNCFGVSRTNYSSQVKLITPAFHFRLLCCNSLVPSTNGNVRDEVENHDDFEEDVEFLSSSSLTKKAAGPWRSKFPLLNQKEMKELRAHAHRLGKDIVVQHIGKWGVTPTLTKSLSDTLEANELIKLKVLGNCPEELQQIVRDLEDNLEAQVVGKIGRMLVVYRPSLRKLETQKQAEHKRRIRARQKKI